VPACSSLRLLTGARHGLLLLVLLAAASTSAAQQLQLVPYFGATFHGSSALLADLEGGSRESASVLGVSLMRLGDGWLGLEADLAHAPGFFERGEREIVVPGSYIATLTSSAVVTLPIRITRESLRPYVVVGGGALRASARDLTGVFPILSTMPVVAMGGGATGFVSNTFGLRFDLRHIRSLGRGDDPLVLEGPRVQFWRGSIGLVFRY